jgi:ferrous iron transport protein B
MSTATITAERELSIGLMGQPNTGKSTLFNALTGSHQHVGNWPGKTVEKKEGFFSQGTRKYKLIDLPGTYSLTANSDEEVITRQYIAGDDLDIVVALVDASQIERSLFLLADYAGINRPVALLLNMIDVAKYQGKSIDAAALSRQLNVPVFPVIASRKNGLEPFYELLDDANFSACTLSWDALASEYRKGFGETFDALLSLLRDLDSGSYANEWIAVKLLEGDTEILNYVRNHLAANNMRQIERLLGQVENGILTAADCKYRWIQNLMKQASYESKQQQQLNRFDRIATSPVLGKLLAIVFILGGLALSMVVGFSLMGGISVVQGAAISTMRSFLESINTSPFLTGILCDAVLTSVFYAIMMSAFVFSTVFIFGFLEEIGYMARISYVFDNLMQKLGLHGKAIMPFLVSFGCNIGGITATRVIDTWKQRLLAIATTWVVPCAATWGVIGMMSSLFFQQYAVWIVLLLFVTAGFHLVLTTKLFSRSLFSPNDQSGLIMELPPYHKPNFKALFRFVWLRVKDMLTRALRLIILITVVFWLLSYSPDGLMSSSLIYKIGTAIEPVTMFFGLNWQLFMAFVAAIMGKEASLGVIVALFTSQSGASNLFSMTLGGAAAAGDMGGILLSTLSVPQALAFMFAFFFNIPCFMSLAATASETHSTKWTLKIALYYVSVALILSGIVYHVSSLFF